MSPLCHLVSGFGGRDGVPSPPEPLAGATLRAAEGSAQPMQAHPVTFLYPAEG